MKKKEKKMSIADVCLSCPYILSENYGKGAHKCASCQWRWNLLGIGKLEKEKNDLETKTAR